MTTPFTVKLCMVPLQIPPWFRPLTRSRHETTPRRGTERALIHSVGCTAHGRNGINRLGRRPHLQPSGIQRRVREYARAGPLRPRQGSRRRLGGEQDGNSFTPSTMRMFSFCLPYLPKRSPTVPSTEPATPGVETRGVNLAMRRDETRARIASLVSLAASPSLPSTTLLRTRHSPKIPCRYFAPQRSPRLFPFVDSDSTIRHCPHSSSLPRTQRLNPLASRHALWPYALTPQSTLSRGVTRPPASARPAPLWSIGRR